MKVVKVTSPLPCRVEVIRNEVVGTRIDIEVCLLHYSSGLSIEVEDCLLDDLISTLIAAKAVIESEKDLYEKPTRNTASG